MESQQPFLRKTIEADLESHFENQVDDEAIYMAAFYSTDPKDKEAYLTKWKRLLKEPTINTQTIMLGEQIVGVISKFEIEGEAEITYALNKKFWRKGLMSEALKKFIQLEQKRPIYGRAATDNMGSIKVLERAGFKFVRHDKGFARARGKEIEEVVYRLD